MRTGDERAVVEDSLSCLAQGHLEAYFDGRVLGGMVEFQQGKSGVGLFAALLTSHARLLRDLPLWEWPQSDICGPRKGRRLSPWGYSLSLDCEPKAPLTSISPQAVHLL